MEGALLDQWGIYAEQQANPLQHPEAAGQRREPVVSDYIAEVRETIDSFLSQPVA